MRTHVNNKLVKYVSFPAESWSSIKMTHSSASQRALSASPRGNLRSQRQVPILNERWYLIKPEMNTQGSLTISQNNNSLTDTVEIKIYALTPLPPPRQHMHTHKKEQIFFKPIKFYETRKLSWLRYPKIWRIWVPKANLEATKNKIVSQDEEMKWPLNDIW